MKLLAGGKLLIKYYLSELLKLLANTTLIYLAILTTLIHGRRHNLVEISENLEVEGEAKCPAPTRCGGGPLRGQLRDHGL